MAEPLASNGNKAIGAKSQPTLSISLLQVTNPLRIGTFMLTRFIAIALMWLPLASVQPNPQPFFNVVTLETSATSEVPADTLAVTLFTEEQGPDPAQLAARANARLEQALTTAKSEAGVEARSGAYQTTPLYDRASQITGWRVRAELVLEGRDFKTVSALAGRLQPAMKLAGMAFSLSRAAREKLKRRCLAKRCASSRRRPSDRKNTGIPGYTLGQIAVRSEGRSCSRLRIAPWPSRKWPTAADRHRRWKAEKTR
jgi:predicted secreted protein